MGSELPQLQDPSADVRFQRFQRMVSAHADALMKPILDDQGSVLNPGISDRSKALSQALHNTNGYISALQGQDPKFAQPMRDYLSGKTDDLPIDYLPDTAPVPSKSTIERNARIEAVRRQANENRKSPDPERLAKVDGLLSNKELPPQDRRKLEAERRDLEQRDTWGAEGARALQAAIDDLAMPVSGFFASKAQIPVDLITGAANLLTDKVPHIDVRAAVLSPITAMGTGDNIFDAYAETAAKLGAIKEGMAGVGSFINKAAEFGGMARGFGIKGVNKALEPGAKIVESTVRKIASWAGRKELPKIAESMARGAGMFAEYNALTARGADGGRPTLGQMAETTAHGLIAGAAIGGFSSLAGSYMKAVLKKPAREILGDDKAMLEAVKAWGKKNGVIPHSNQSPDSYLEELTRRWAAAGAPGAKTSVRKMVALVGGAVIEGAGFSMLDEQFRSDLYEVGHKIANGQTPTSEELESIFSTYGASTLGLLGAKMPLGQIPALQRRATARGERATAPSVERAPEPKLPDVKPEAVGQEPPPDTASGSPPPLTEAEMWSRHDQAYRQTARYQEQVKQEADQAANDLWDILFGAQEREALRSDAEKAASETLKKSAEGAQQAWEDVVSSWESPDLERLGWKRSRTETGSDLYEIPGTDMSFEVTDRSARPNKALRELMDLPSEVDADQVGEILERASLMSAMKGKAFLPGTEIGADGVVAEAGNELRPPVMRAVRLGTIYESPLQPVADWKPAGQVPGRGKDALLPKQREAVNDLRTILDHRLDLDPIDRAMLNGAIEILDAVSAEKNQSVAEALHFLPNYLEEIAAGDPMTAGRRIKTLAETLTTKAPETVVSTEAAQLNRYDREEAKRAAYAKNVSERTVPEGTTSKVTMRPDAARFLSEFVPSETALGQQLETLGKGTDRGEITASAPEYKQLVSTLERFLPRVQQRLQGSELKQFRSRAAAAEAKVEELGRGFGFEPPRYDPYTGTYGYPKAGGSEAGFLDASAVASGIKRVVDKVTGLFKDGPVVGLYRAIGGVVANPLTDLATRAISQNAIQALREGGQRELADRFEQVAVNTRKVQQEASQALEAVAKEAKWRLPELEKATLSEVSDTGARGSYDLGHILSETRLMERFGVSDAQVDGSAKAAVNAHRALTKKLRSVASRLGIKIRNSEGKYVPVRESTDMNVMTRMPTSRLVDAIASGKGSLYEDIVSVFAKENGKTAEEIKEMFSEQRATWQEVKGLEKIDPIEVMRTLRYMPDHIITRDGSTVRLLETNIGRHATRMAESAAKRFGVIQEFGQNLKAEGEPSTYSKIISGIDDIRMQKVAATAFRSSMGMMLNEPFLASHGIESGSGIHSVVEMASAAMDVMAALKMTMSPIQNVTESFGTASGLLGADRVGAGQAYFLSAAMDGTLKDAIQDRVSIGGFHLNHPEFIFGGETGAVDSIKTAARGAANVAMVPFEVSQLGNDIAVHRAIELAVQDMRAGNGRASDAVMLKSLHGFTEAEAKAMLEGNGTDAQYDRVLYNSLAHVTKRGELPLEKSALGQGRVVQKIVRFTGYFQRQLMTLRQHAILMKEAKTPEQAHEAAFGMAKMLGFNMVAFAAGQTLYALLRGGEKEVSALWADMADRPGSAVASALLGSFLGAPGSVISGSLMAALSGSKDDKAQALEQIGTLALPVSEAIHMWQFTHAMLQRASGDAVTEGPYIGKTPLQQLGYFAGLEVPALRTALGGLAGIAPNYMGTDPNLESAMRMSYRWDDKNGYKGGFSTADDEEHAKFLDVMRGVANRIKAGDDPDTLEDMIRKAMPDKPDKSIISSLMARRMMSGANWTKLSEEDKVRKLRHLGPDRIETLRGWDLALEALADRFRPMFRR